MRTLLVLALSLAMASVAHAGLVFQSSRTEVYPGATVTVNLVTTYGTAVSAWGFDALTGLGTASNPVINPGFESQVIGAMNPAAGLLSWYTYAIDTETPVKYYSGVLFSFQLHIPEDVPYSTIIVINTMSDGVDYLPAYYFTATGGMIEGNFGALVLHPMPEPMTIGLLGIGGLFLRRRR